MFSVPNIPQIRLGFDDAGSDSGTSAYLSKSNMLGVGIFISSSTQAASWAAQSLWLYTGPLQHPKSNVGRCLHLIHFPLRLPDS